MLSQHAAQACVRVIRRQPVLNIQYQVTTCLSRSINPPSQLHTPNHTRPSSSSTRWKSRQAGDSYAREAKVQGLKSRAAFKLLEIDAKYKIFKKGQTVVDLGYAPGSWSQVAVERTKPNGRIVGIDIIPAQPPKGVSTIQGNFLSPEVRAEVKRFVQDPNRGRAKPPVSYLCDDTVEIDNRSYIDQERHADEDGWTEREFTIDRKKGRQKMDVHPGRTVDVVLSDMCEPWAQTTGFWKRTLSNPYVRMMNTSGINFKDHTGSMDLCAAALLFAHDTLKVGGHFVCKFYQGAEDKLLENQLRKMFSVVHKEKPKSSRSESNEAYFVALRRKNEVSREDVKSVLESTQIVQDDRDVGEEPQALLETPVANGDRKASRGNG